MENITTIDCYYYDQPEFAAAYLITEKDEAAFIDNNTNLAVPRLMAALEQQGLTPEQVRYIIITHVHLDHAGATATLANLCPNAKVVAHPRAAVHVINPEKLVASASQVYGKKEFERLYGRIAAVPEDRVKIMEDEDRLDLAGRELTFLHTRGHANHHFVVVDPDTDSVFTGDAFGLVYPALQRDGLFAIPSTSPTDFDAHLARVAIKRILDLKPKQVFPTHFGGVTDVDRVGEQLIRHLDFSESLLDDAELSDLPDVLLEDYCKTRIRDYLTGLLDRCGSMSSDPEILKVIGMDVELNGQGVAYVAQKRRRKKREAMG